ncbi:DUF5406 family protein [Stutzerimonas kunmingensis]|uniref:DUF5406 family protein n=1 Tax=Stutzerimonas kunmingensis TaxID=1211807 RepID=UPI0028B1EB8A|nr:DUF5406 family protein [Stutzerimonas kunmingensis]
MDVMDYDPNLTNSGRMAKQTVRLTFAQWKYRAVVEQMVGGNCTGLTVIDCAVENAWEALPENAHGAPYLVMEAQDGSGDTLYCADDEEHGEDWLKDMLISAEIVSICPK